MENEEANDDAKLSRIINMKADCKELGRNVTYQAANGMTDEILCNKYEVMHKGKTNP